MEKQQSSFKIEDIIKIYIEKWYIGATAILLCLLLCTVYIFGFSKEYYQATTTIYITEEVTAEKQENTELMVNEERAKDYKFIITSDRVLDKAREKLGYVEINPNMISVIEHPDTRIMKISFKDTDPYKCTEIVNVVTDILIQEIDEIISKNNIKIIDKAKVPQSPQKVNMKVYYFLALIAAIVGSFILVCIIEIFDNKIKGIDDCKEKFDIPILGTIPKYDLYKEVEKNAEEQ